MRGNRFTVAVTLAFACRRAATDVPGRYGLHETPAQHDLVERAIVLADATLPPDQPLRLAFDWRPSGFYPRLYFEPERGHGFSAAVATELGFDNGFRFMNADRIPVYLIDGQDLGDIEVAFVPDGERCIFINASTLEHLFEDFFIAGPRAVHAENSFDKALVLAVVLLHELGHLYYADHGSYGVPAVLDVDTMSGPREAIANHEIRADRFASDAVAAALESGETKGSLDSYGRAQIANHMIRIILTGLNAHDYSGDPRGLLHGVAHPEIFRQIGYSHLNLYVRLLVWAELLDPSVEHRAELRWLSAISAN